MSKPYLSIVCATRNDGKETRLPLFLDVLQHHLSRVSVTVEVVVVNWNYLEAGSDLFERINLSLRPQNLTIRHIKVPQRVHNEFPGADVSPFFQMIAKNTGICRGTGDYILVTNPDIIFSEEFTQYIGCMELSDRLIYRVDREDVPDRVTPEMDIEALLRFCADNVYLTHQREGAVTSLDGRVGRSRGCWPCSGRQRR